MGNILAARYCVLLFVIIECLGTVSIAMCQSVCPVRCLCYLRQQPRIVACSKQGLESFPANITDIVEHLDLSGNLLAEITSDINRLAELQYLNLAQNRLNSLPDLGNLRSLRRLDLSENNVLDVRDIASLSQLPSLMVLYLSRNPLQSLDGLASDTLQHLDVSHCGIQEVTNTSLDGMPVLLSLSLAGNPLKSIQNPYSRKLRWLDMSNCQLNYLNPDTFSGFPELEDLRLASNPTLVYSTRRSTLRHLNLKRIDVSRCNLDRPGLHGFPLLTHAHLSRNSIRLLPDRIFAKNRHLTQLLLNFNNLERLNASTFEGLVKLQILDLSANGLEEIHRLAFHENINLRMLNLSYNALFQFPNLTSAVTSLDLSSNLISSMKRDSLTNMPRIRNLNLNDNRLRFLPDGLKSATLRNLDLRRNSLIHVTNNSFTELPSLQILDLSGNRLTEAMDPEVFRKNPDLTAVYLEDNPWRCDCEQIYLTFEFLTESPAKTIGSNLICQSPANVSGYSWESACFNIWHGGLYYSKERTWGLVLVSMLIMVVMAGTVVSIRHTMKMKRRAMEHRQQLETSEARERLRLLRRRNQQLEEELLDETSEPRINPLELVGPPSYEEAVHMPRLARSLDALDEISTENVTSRVMGSVDNLRAKKRRTRRPRKRTLSEDDLLRREERRQERIRRERTNSTGNILENVASSESTNPSFRSSTARRNRRQSMIDESVDSGSSRGRPRPQTPSARKRKKRKRIVGDGHTTDDEDSDIQKVDSNRSIVIRELRREPRSGYRESIIERDP